MNEDFTIFFANKYFCNGIKVPETSLNGLHFSDISNFNLKSYINSKSPSNFKKYAQIDISFNKQNPKEYLLLLTNLSIEMTDEENPRNLTVLILQDTTDEEFEQNNNPVYLEWIKEAKNNISLVVFVYESGYGPKTIFVVNDQLFNRSKEPSELVISKIGLYLMAAIAQGTTQSTGLFGPLPVSGPEFSNINTILYALHINDKSQDDPRTDGTRYVLVSIFYPKVYERIILNRRRIRTLILNYFQVEDISLLTEDLIKKLYDEIFLIDIHTIIPSILPPVPKKTKKKYRKKISNPSFDSKLLKIVEFQNKIRDIYDLDLTINEIANIIEEFLDFKLLAIFGYDKFADELYILNTRGYYDYKLKNVRININESSVVSKSALTKETLYVPDVTKIDYYLNVDPSIKSDIAVPIKNKNELLGVIILESDQIDPFSQDDINILEILAENTATAINQHQNEIMVHDLNVLLKTILILEFDEAIKEIAKFAEILLNFEIFCILDTRSEYVRFLAQRGYGKSENLPKFKRDDKNFFVSQVYLTKEAMYVDNLKEYPDIAYYKVKNKINSEYCIPIINSSDEVLALINVEAESPLNRHELVIFETLANYTKLLYRIFFNDTKF